MAVWAAERVYSPAGLSGVRKSMAAMLLGIQSMRCTGVVFLDADEALSDTDLSKTDRDLLHHALTSTGRGGDSSLAARFGFLGLYVTDMSMTECRYRITENQMEKQMEMGGS